MPEHYIILHYITLHYITLHYITLHYHGILQLALYTDKIAVHRVNVGLAQARSNYTFSGHLGADMGILFLSLCLICSRIALRLADYVSTETAWLHV